MKSEFNFIDVIDRAKKALKIKQDNEVAEALGMSAASFNGRKKTDSLPYEALLALANKEKIDFNWLLTGEGKMLKGGGASNDENISPKRREMLRLLEQLDDNALDDAIYSTKKLVENCEVRTMLGQLLKQQGKQHMAA